MKYITIHEDSIPGVTLVDGVPYGELGGQYFRVIGVTWSGEAGGFVPVLDLPMMDESPREAAI